MRLFSRATTTASSTSSASCLAVSVPLLLASTTSTSSAFTFMAPPPSRNSSHQQHQQQQSQPQQQQQQQQRPLATTTTSTSTVMMGSSSTAATTSESSSSSSSTTTKTDNDKDKDKDTIMLQSILDNLVNSWPRQLSAETADNLRQSRQYEGLSAETDQNRTKRPVYNGHYVLVEPTGLKEPRLVLYSHDVASNLLHLTPQQMESQPLLEFLSGNRVLAESWATPYALSIMGTRYTNNCPYGTGDGYGDGRAISIGEFKSGHELQLKGAGTTPFHRGADGRAVLRSSIREFLASEAMHSLGVSTTRALSLVVSQTDTVQRPWYSDNAALQLPAENDARLQQYTAEQRQQLLRQLRNQKADPNILITEPQAITCRVATSFTRIGHLDLFARRVEQHSSVAMADGTLYDTTTRQWQELTDMIWHACLREFKEEAYDPYIESNDIASAATVLLQKSAENIATMVADWVRVGFIQGNFNADNCLVAGRTMDYGPFGFVEEYQPLAAKWTGSGAHFGFRNQPNAGFANYNVLVASVVPVICAAAQQTATDAAAAATTNGDDNNENKSSMLHQNPDEVAKPFLEQAARLFEQKVDEVLRVKLGFETDQDVADDLWSTLEPLLQRSRVDWTIFFRQLTYVVRDFDNNNESKEWTDKDYAGMFSLVEGNDEERAGSSPFYEPLSDEQRKEWIAWMEQWRTALDATNDSSKAVFERMRTANPKYILREWMLVEAYTNAAKGQEAELFSLYDLIQRPYDEGTDKEVERYYRRVPDEALLKGGTAFMS